MRKLVTIALALCAFGLVLPAGASAATTYCSESGDVCYGKERGNPIVLSITTAARYFRTYKLCVRNPLGVRSCRRFRMKAARGGVYRSRVLWRRYFADGGRGRYTARWYALGSRLGPAVTFRRGLSSNP